MACGLPDLLKLCIFDLFDLEIAMTKIFAAAALLIVLVAIVGAYRQRSALYLRQEAQPNYWPRHGTVLSGRYQGNIWQPLPIRSAFGAFQGGGPSSGK